MILAVGYGEEKKKDKFSNGEKETEGGEESIRMESRKENLDRSRNLYGRGEPCKKTHSLPKKNTDFTLGLDFQRRFEGGH